MRALKIGGLCCRYLCAEREEDELMGCELSGRLDEMSPVYVLFGVDTKRC